MGYTRPNPYMRCCLGNFAQSGNLAKTDKHARITMKSPVKFDKEIGSTGNNTGRRVGLHQREHLGERRRAYVGRHSCRRSLYVMHYRTQFLPG